MQAKNQGATDMEAWESIKTWKESVPAAWEKEKARLGDDFDLKYFMDTILKAGAIPIDEFESIFGE